MKTVVPMGSNGTLTIPSQFRHQLAVTGAVLVELETANHTIALRPAEEIPAEDLWAYTPDHMALVERAWREEPGPEISRADLVRLIETADQ